MVIKQVHIRHFRSIREATLNCEPLTALVGRNGAGKSSFLRALDVFYNIAAPITIEDVFARDEDSPIAITVTYGDLRDDEIEEFSTYVTAGGELAVTKRIVYENGGFTQKYYSAAPQIPQFADIRKMSGKQDRKDAWHLLVEQAALPDLPGKARSADQVDQFMETYELANSELTERLEQEEQFFGPKNIGGGKLDNYTKFVIVPAVREASDEISEKRGAAYQLINTIVARQVEARQDLQQFRAEFEERASELYSCDNLTELPELGRSISATLGQFCPGAELNLKWDEVKLPTIGLPAPLATLIEDGFEGQVGHKGHGLQRALIVVLLQHLAMIPPPSSGENQVEGALGPDLIIAIEEPELYLHPSRCRYLSDLLLRLSDDPSLGLGTRNQIIYTTHSPYFVDLDRFASIRIVRKPKSEEAPAPHSIVRSLSVQDACDRLAAVCCLDPSNVTEESFKARSTPIMSATVNEGFFADVAVIVEGLSDASVVWKIQELLDKDWAALGIVVVPALGKENIDRPRVIFRGLGIPTYFLFDADVHLRDKEAESQAIRRNHRYLRLAGVDAEDFPITQIHDTWAVFADTMEDTIKDAVGPDVYDSVRSEVASALGYDKPNRAAKNPDGATRIIELIYKSGKQVPELEQIVEQITQLRVGA